MRLSVDSLSGSAPTGLANEARNEPTNRTSQTVVAVSTSAIERPPHEQGPSDDSISRQEAPEAAVDAPIAVVSHDEEMTRRYPDRIHMISRPEVLSRWLLEDGIGLVKRLAIDVDTDAEKSYLAMLAARLQLPPELVEELNRQVEIQTSYPDP